MTHHIFRTVEELEALDPETVILCADKSLDLAGEMAFRVSVSMVPLEEELPAVVVTTGYQVRAARKALEDA